MAFMTSGGGSIRWISTRPTRTPHLSVASSRMLRSAALIDRHGGTWSLPEQIPTLVADGYGKEPLCAQGLREEEERCRQEWAADERNRSKKADPYLLTRQEVLVKPTLAGLHAKGVGVHQEEVLQALVRDGQLTVEVIIVRYQDGEYRSLSGDRLGVHGEASEHVREKVLGGLTRLPPRLTKPAQALVPLEGWRDDPWLRYFPALVLGPDGWASLGEERVGYDPESGLKTVRIK
jgi:CRISPR-associated endonuclease/helicase Cas3